MWLSFDLMVVALLLTTKGGRTYYQNPLVGPLLVSGQAQGCLVLEAEQPWPTTTYSSPEKLDPIKSALKTYLPYCDFCAVDCKQISCNS